MSHLFLVPISELLLVNNIFTIVYFFETKTNALSSNLKT